MRTILIAVITLSSVSLGSAQDWYAKWEFHDVGTHHLPPNWSMIGGYGDWSGLITTGGDSIYPPTIFNVHTGDSVQLEGIVRFLGMAGTEVFVATQTGFAIYHYDTGEQTPIEGLADAISPDGDIALGLIEDHFGLTESRSIVSQDTGQKIEPPLVEVAPGVSFPDGHLTATDFAANGWIAGYTGYIPEPDIGFVANLITGEFRLLQHQPKAVSDSGHVAVSYDDATPIRGVRGPVTDILQINSTGQVVNALAFDNEGRVLVLDEGPIVSVFDPDLEETIEYQTYKLVMGLPLLIAGDFDASGGANQGDLDLVLLNWGANAPAEWVHDTASVVGAIDQAELDRILLNWGNTTGVSVLPEVEGTAGVPEPETLLLGAMLWLLMPILRRHVNAGRRTS